MSWTMISTKVDNILLSGRREVNQRLSRIRGKEIRINNLFTKVGAEVFWQGEVWLVFDAIATGRLPGSRTESRTYLGGVVENEVLIRNPAAYDIRVTWTLVSKDLHRFASGVESAEILPVATSD